MRSSPRMARFVTVCSTMSLVKTLSESLSKLLAQLTPTQSCISMITSMSNQEQENDILTFIVWTLPRTLRLKGSSARSASGLRLEFPLTGLVSCLIFIRVDKLTSARLSVSL